MQNYDGLLNKKEKKRKNILVVRLRPMKRKQLGLLRVIDISKKKFKDIKICWYLDTCWIDCGYNSYHYCMVIGWLI